MTAKKRASRRAFDTSARSAECITAESTPGE
jgi:hypothetical protein